ncbi:MAG: hypothetical protein WHS87_11720 [Anaerolineales bacterium]
MSRKTLTTWMVALFFIVAGLSALGISFPYQQPLQGLLGVLAGILLILER